VAANLMENPPIKLEHYDQEQVVFHLAFPLCDGAKVARFWT